MSGDLTQDQLTAVRAQVAQSGYLPLSNKAIRLLDELERSGAEPTLAAELRTRLDGTGYLPQSKALRLLEAVEQLRAASQRV